MSRMSGVGRMCWMVARKLRFYAGALAIFTLVAVTWALLMTPPASPEMSAHNPDASVALETAGSDVSGWGREALNVVHEQAVAWSPIAVANACGMGASSCFKCHNGKRAEAPKMDKKAHPWHADHKNVNDSCVGCHSGNARIIKQDIAHAGLIKDPRPKPEVCATCHKSGDVSALLKSYQKSTSGGK